LGPLLELRALLRVPKVDFRARQALLKTAQSQLKVEQSGLRKSGKAL
jgi:hypothetical protein